MLKKLLKRGDALAITTREGTITVEFQKYRSDRRLARLGIAAPQSVKITVVRKEVEAKESYQC